MRHARDFRSETRMDAAEIDLRDQQNALLVKPPMMPVIRNSRRDCDARPSRLPHEETPALGECRGPLGSSGELTSAQSANSLVAEHAVTICGFTVTSQENLNGPRRDAARKGQHRWLCREGTAASAAAIQRDHTIHPSSRALGTAGAEVDTTPRRKWQVFATIWQGLNWFATAPIPRTVAPTQPATHRQCIHRAGAKRVAQGIGG